MPGTVTNVMSGTLAVSCSPAFFSLNCGYDIDAQGAETPPAHLLAVPMLLCFPDVEGFHLNLHDSSYAH